MQVGRVLTDRYLKQLFEVHGKLLPAFFSTGRLLADPFFDAFGPFLDPLGRRGKTQTDESRRAKTVAGNGRHLDVIEDLPGDSFGGPQFGKIAKQVKRPLGQNIADLRDTL